MSAEIQIASKPGEVVRAHDSEFLAVIAAAARDPQVDVAKMEALLQMKERIDARSAEAAFHAAMSRLQPKLPIIDKKGKIVVKDELRSKYARYEDIDAAIRPLLCEEGFSLSFDSEPTPQGVVYHGTLAHSQGHSKRASMVLPPDTSGSKNSIQAIGSTVKYAQRYLVTMLLNIITKGADDDGQAAGFINEEQVLAIVDLLKAIGLKESDAKFLAWAGADKIEHIQSIRYPEVIKELNKRRGQK